MAPTCSLVTNPDDGPTYWGDFGVQHSSGTAAIRGQHDAVADSRSNSINGQQREAIRRLAVGHVRLHQQQLAAVHRIVLDGGNGLTNDVPA